MYTLFCIALGLMGGMAVGVAATLTAAHSSTPPELTMTLAAVALFAFAVGVYYLAYKQGVIDVMDRLVDPTFPPTPGNGQSHGFHSKKAKAYAASNVLPFNAASGQSAPGEDTSAKKRTSKHVEDILSHLRAVDKKTDDKAFVIPFPVEKDKAE